MSGDFRCRVENYQRSASGLTAVDPMGECGVGGLRVTARRTEHEFYSAGFAGSFLSGGKDWRILCQVGSIAQP